MNRAWFEHVETCSESHRDDQKKQDARALTVEFGQPLVQTFRRRRPSPARRSATTPLFDPEQLTIDTAGHPRDQLAGFQPEGILTECPSARGLAASQTETQKGDKPMTMKKSDIRAHLVAARALIETPAQWTKSTYCQDVDGVKARCASGAIVTAIGNCTEAVTVLAHLQRTIKRHRVECPTIVHWNDHPDRTHAEVLQAFGWAIGGEPQGEPPAGLAADESAA